MKISIPLIMLLLLLQSGYDDFITLFPKLEYNEQGNFLTRSLNAKDYLALPKSYSLIPQNESFLYLCDNDSSQFFYEYGLYNMDEDRITEYVKEIYQHYAIGVVKSQNFDMVILMTRLKDIF